MSPERKKMITAAIIVVVVIILLLLLRKKPAETGRGPTIPDVGFTPPNYLWYNLPNPVINYQPLDYPDIPPFDINTNEINYPPPGSCGCGGAGGLLPDFQSLLNLYTQNLGSLLQTYYNGIQENLPGYVAQFVHVATGSEESPIG